MWKVGNVRDRAFEGVRKSNVEREREIREGGEG